MRSLLRPRFVVALVLLGLVFAFGDAFREVNLVEDITRMERDIRPYVRAELQQTALSSRKMMAYAMEVTKVENFAPANAARFYAYAATVYDEVLAATEDTAQATAAAVEMIRTLAPDHLNETATFEKGLGALPPLSEEARAVLEGYKERTKGDRYDLVWDKQTPEGKWYIRDNRADKGARSGEWLTWIVEPGATFEVPPPPEEGSLLDEVEMERVKYALNQRKVVDFDTIFFWHGSTGVQKGAVRDNVTPAGVWQNIFFVEIGETLTDAEYARAQKLLAQSIADSFIESWRVKYDYWTKRPSMRIEGLATLFADPPFPSYVSGHSTISGTAAVVLSSLYPAKTDIWMQNMKDARYSRLAAGIHFDVDNRNGEYLGKNVGEAIVAKLSHGTYAPKDHREVLENKSTLGFLRELALLRLQPRVTLAMDRVANRLARIRSGPQFADVLTEAGLESTIRSTGAAWSDYDRDGDLDLFAFGGTNRVYRNSGDGTFEDVTATTNIPTNMPFMSGVLGDYDNDGCPDLFGVVWGARTGDRLFRNKCDGTFTDVTGAAEIADPDYHGFGAAWADYDNDGNLDIYVANYGFPSSKTEYFSQPNALWHNNGDGTFTEVAAALGVAGGNHCGLKASWEIYNSVIGGPYKQSFQPIWFDYDNDLDVDLFVATDSGVSPLYRNNGEGTFTEVTKDAGLCRVGTGMGVTAGDYDNDGDFDLYVTNTGANFHWMNNGDGTFTESSRLAKTADLISLGWGTGFLDYDNDGDLDLYVVNGRVLGEIAWNPAIGAVRLDRLYRNNGDGTFTDVSETEGIYGDDDKESAAFADYNEDGFVDIAVVSSHKFDTAADRLYRNRDNGNHWLTVALVGTRSNRDSVGAVITVTAGEKTQKRQVTSGSSFIAQNSLRETFGLGSATEAEKVEIRWPSGTVKTLSNIAADQKLTVAETE